MYPEVEWRALSGFRNVLVHDYLGVNLESIWQILEEKIPDFRLQIEKMKSDLV